MGPNTARELLPTTVKIRQVSSKIFSASELPSGLKPRPYAGHATPNVQVPSEHAHEVASEEAPHALLDKTHQFGDVSNGL